jgi:hypothetical protein
MSLFGPRLKGSPKQSGDQRVTPANSWSSVARSELSKFVHRRALRPWAAFGRSVDSRGPSTRAHHRRRIAVAAWLHPTTHPAHPAADQRDERASLPARRSRRRLCAVGRRCGVAGVDRMAARTRFRRLAPEHLRPNCIPRPRPAGAQAGACRDSRRIPQSRVAGEQGFSAV